MTGRQDFVGGAAVLTIAALAVKILGALYKIPLGNLLDSQGMAHFHVAYNIYNLLLLLSTAGLPLALSRLVAQALALGRERQARRVFHVALGLFLLPGLGCSALMWWAPEALAGLLRDSMAAPAIRALAPSVLAVCLLSAFRGESQGRGKMGPTALSQVTEALCRLAVGLPLAWYLLKSGAPAHQAAAGAILGVSAGSVLALLGLFLGHLRRWQPCRGQDLPQSQGAIARSLLSIGLPITVGAGGMSAITLLDQLLVMDTLQSALGCTESRAASLYGEYTFSACLFTLPAALIVPLTVSLLPALTAALARRENETAAHLVSAALSMTVLFSLGAGTGLHVLAAPLLSFLYPAVPQTACAAAVHLEILALGCPLVCLMQVSAGILQAFGRERWPVAALALGGAVKVAVSRLLVADPAIGIRGASIGTVCCYGAITLVQLVLLQRLVPLAFPLWRPCLAAGGMALCLRCLGPVLLEVSPRWGVLLCVPLGAAVYGFGCFWLGAVPREVLRFLSERKKIADFLKISVTSP